MEEKITICSVGDLMVCDSPLYASVGVGSKYQSIRKKLMTTCRQLFEGADLVIGNFETVVYKPRNKTLTEIQMSCPEQVIEDLKKSGFSVFNLANNHCLQHGTQGFNNTEESCIRNGIIPIGRRDRNLSLIEIKGRKIALLSCCVHLEWYQPDYILYEDRLEKILKDVKSIRESEPSTVIVVSIHWGDEFAAYPSNAQVALAHKLVDLGANIVLGHHSHVYQGIEQYNGAIIAYSQGNFVSDMIPEICRETGCLRIEIDSNEINCCFQPLHIGDDYVPIKDDGVWFKDREKMLRDVLSGNNSDDQYWHDISQNHSIGHNAFKKYFKTHLLNYKKGVATRMVLDFVKRKMKRMVGTSTDGRVSSMDPSIMESISKIE